MTTVEIITPPQTDTRLALIERAASLMARATARESIVVLRDTETVGQLAQYEETLHAPTNGLGQYSAQTAQL